MSRGPVFSGLKLKAKLWQPSEDEQILVLNTLPYDAQRCWCSGCPHTVSWWFQRTVSCDSDPSWAAAVGSEHCDDSGTDRSRGAWTGKQFVTDGTFRSASASFEPGEVPTPSYTYFGSAPVCTHAAWGESKWQSAYSDRQNLALWRVFSASSAMSQSFCKENNL